jgi:hypothetical protein
MSDVTTNNSTPSPAAPTVAEKTVTEKTPVDYKRVLRDLVRQPRFLVALAILLLFAVGFNVLAAHLNFEKRPLKLSVKGLDDKETGIGAALPVANPNLAPEKAGRWVQMTPDRPMAANVEETLGTKKYLSRVYVDRIAANRSVEELRRMDEKQANEFVGMLQSRDPTAVVHVHITYYTGLIDNVAHIPDRCYVASGFKNTMYLLRDVPEKYVDGKARSVKYRHMRFEDQQSRAIRYVGYMFNCNGSYTDDPFEVRKRLQNLFESYGYYAKVELMVSDPAGRAGDAMQNVSADVMNRFLHDLLPELERCLPDWQRVQAGDPAAISPP